MQHLVETLKINKNTVCNVKYHNLRMNKTRNFLFNEKNKLNLQTIIHIPPDNDRILKCRVIYNTKIIRVEFHDYTKKNITSLKIVYNDLIDYRFKYENREALNRLREQRGTCDDILIVKNGKITDTSFANIVFYNGEQWLTPASPLLEGTMRQKLLDEKKIKTADITCDDLKYFKRAKLINCMLDFDDNDYIEIRNIVE